MWSQCEVRVQIGTPRFKETGIGTQDRDPGPGPRTGTQDQDRTEGRIVVAASMLEWVECIMVLTTPIFTLFTSLFPFWQQKRNMKLNFCVFAIATFSTSIKCISAEDVSHLVSCEEESRSGQKASTMMTCYCDGEAGCIFLIFTLVNLLRNLSQLLSPVHDLEMRTCSNLQLLQAI